MQNRSGKISQRTFVLGLACPILVCAIAFFVCYGRNVAWGLLHLWQTQRAPLSSVNLNSAPRDEEYLACSFLNVALDVPASMARNPQIVESSGSSWLVFADQTRKIRIPLSSNKVQRSGYGAIPASLDKLTNTELLVLLYNKGSKDFSWGMNRTQLQEHDWAMNCRDLFSYERHLDNITSATQGNVQLVVLSPSNPKAPQGTNRLLAFANWSLADNSDGGMVYFFDDGKGATDWAIHSATSLRRPDHPTAASASAFAELIANSTNDQLLQKIETSSTATAQ